MLSPHVPISQHLGNEACEHREGRLASSASPQLVVVNHQSQDIVR